MPCFSCQKGDYQPLEGQSSCLKCRANTTTPGEGSNSSVECGGKSLNNNCAILDQLEIELAWQERVATCPPSPLMTENSRQLAGETLGWCMQFLSRAHSHAERFADEVA